MKPCLTYLGRLFLIKIPQFKWGVELFSLRSMGLKSKEVVPKNSHSMGRQP